MIKNKLESILKERKEKNFNDDYGIQSCWDKMVDILSQNEEETITYLKECNKDDLLLISEVFEDISEQLQSKSFIECLKELDKKYPELNMTKDIDIAEDYLS